MTRLLVHRLLMSIPVLFVVSILVFVLQELVPGDAAVAIIGYEATEEQYDAIRQELGLDRSMLERYGAWLSDLAHGSLGHSLLTGEPVVGMLNDRIWATFSIVIGLMVVSTLVGVLLGIVSAVRKGAVGRSVDVLSMVGMGIPNFWLGLVLISLFAVTLGWLPATGYVPLRDDPGNWLKSLVLPVAAMAFGAVPVLAKQTRDSMSDVLERPFIRALRASGLNERTVIWKHGLKNAALPVVTVVGMLVAAALAGTVFIEQIFVIPGLGSLAVQATQQSDLPVIEGIALYITVMTIVINTVVDITYAWLNPKVRVS